MKIHSERCTCRECRELDAMPERLQGIPGTFQFALFTGEPNVIEYIGSTENRPPIIGKVTREISAHGFGQLVELVREAGYADDIEWSENVRPPGNAYEFAREAIFVICNSGMRFTVAQGIFDRVMVALEAGESASTAFGHKGKTGAIDTIWRDRARLLREYRKAPDKLAFCEALPWIGGITKYHLAKNFGAQVAKPDVHLQRLADWEGTTVQELCERLSAETGYRVPTVDTVLWRACATGIISSRELGA